MIGLIYKTQPYQESNRMLFAFSERGKITLIARGSQRLSSDLRLMSQYLTLIEFYDNGKSMQPLRDAKLIDEFKTIKEDFTKTKYAAIMLEAIDKVYDTEINHQAILQELLEALASPNLKEATLSFLIKFASEVGYRPNLLADGRKVVGFNLEHGSLVYEDSALKSDLNVRHLIILMKLLNLSIEKLEPIGGSDYEEVKNFIKKYYEYHLRVSLKNI